jgi:hypothetical protein
LFIVFIHEISEKGIVMSHKNNRVSVIAEHYQGIEVKSAHDICRTVASEMRRRKVAIEDIPWHLGHNDDATTRTYILNNQGKQKTSGQIINALSEKNGSDVLMGTQNSRNEKSPEAF